MNGFRGAAELDAFARVALEDLHRDHLAVDATRAAFELFHSVVRDVPAYRAFLSERGVDPASIVTPADFARVPLTTKPDYLRRFPLPELCRGGTLDGCDIVAVSSGSTGEPTFFPRAAAHELAVARRFEHVFRGSFRAHERRTLAVVCFPLGTWVGGVYTASACRHLAGKGYHLTVLTPGNVKPEILRVVTALGPLFEQTILLGYPPFLKDVIDTGAAAGVDWSRYAIGLVLAGEVFSEAWRTLMGERARITDVTRATASLYGTADGGVLGNETPLSIAIRRFVAERPERAEALFGSTRLPTLVQYDPVSRYFESIDGSLVFSADGGIPLVRYQIGDTGGIVPFDEMMERVAALGFDADAALSRSGTSARDAAALPFAFVFGRSHFAVSYYGANVFPEMVSLGLEQPAVRESVTGKFVMEVVEDADKNALLTIAVELARGVVATEALGRAAATCIAEALVRTNSEFAGYVPAERKVPAVTLWPLEHPDYFPTGVKHRYVRTGPPV